jgi:hypothetical protein
MRIEERKTHEQGKDARAHDGECRVIEKESTALVAVRSKGLGRTGDRSRRRHADLGSDSYWLIVPFAATVSA